MDTGDDSQQQTALHVILRNCEQYSAKPALYWLDMNCKVTEKYTYEEVEYRSRELARGLLGLVRSQRKENGSSAAVVEVRERAVLCFPPGLEFLLTFLACLRAGIIAVPVSPPNPYQSAYTSETLLRIIHDCGAAFVLTSKQLANNKSIIKLIKKSRPVPWHCEVATEIFADQMDAGEGGSDSEMMGVGEGGNSELFTDELGAGEGGSDSDIELDMAKPEHVPFLQYTSGSTGTPKGVMPSYNSLLHNLEMMKQIMKTDSSMVEISFLPHFHYMGLVCSYLQPLYHGGTGYFMSPSTFVQNPGLWLKAFSMYKGTHAKAPNLAFELVLKKGFPDNLDLSSAHYWVNGSEPVYAETIQRFESALAPSGLKRNTVHAGYGLAEHTMYLCGVWDKEDPTIASGRISCGQPTAGVTVKVVDPDSLKEVPVGEEGEIWVNSESKALGYWEKKEETQKVFEAKLDNFSDRTYLRTGDLGFIMNREVFISGQLCDLITYNGRKIHPSDIEMRIESSFYALRSGRTVACQLKDGSEVQCNEVTYVAELRSPKGFSTVEFQSLAMKIASIISLDFQVQVEAVVFIQPFTLPLTISGKRQRTLCKHMLLNKTLEVVYHWSRAMPAATVDEVRANADSDTSSPKPINDKNVRPTRKDQMMLKSERRKSTSPLPMRRKSLHTITDRMSDVLGVQLQPDSNIWEYGCNSVKAVQLSQCFQSEYGFAIEPRLFFTHQTPLALMGKLQRCLLSVTSHPPSHLENTDSGPYAGGNIVLEGNHGNHQEKEMSNTKKEIDKEGVNVQERSTPASGTDMYASPKERAEKYLKEHKIIELFNNITAEMVIKRPEDPKVFVRDYIKQLLKAKADPDNVDPPCMFEESNIKSVFFMLDLTKKGYISLNQYLQAMNAFGLSKFNQKPAGSDFDKISLETFIRESKVAFRVAYSTYKDS